jgi:hypothetical protein
MISRRRDMGRRLESLGPRPFFVLSQDPRESAGEDALHPAADSEDLERAVRHLLSGKVALVASEAWCLAAQVKGRWLPELHIAALQVTPRRSKIVIVPLQGGIEERRKEIRGQLDFALRPPRTY